MYFYCNEFKVSIYGDGDREYNGYYLITFDEFDECANPTLRKKVLYVEAKTMGEVKEFICHIIKENFVEVFRDNEKLHVSKQWAVVAKGE